MEHFVSMVILSHVQIASIQVGCRKPFKFNQPHSYCFIYETVAFHRNCRFSPKLLLGVLQKKKYENAFTIDKKSWGYRANARLEDFMSQEQLIKGNGHDTR